MNNKSARVQWVDILKFVSIMWVMLSHLESRTDVLKVFYMPFALNAFYFASGYVYKHKDNFNIFLKKKIKGLLWPWFSLSLIDILLGQIISFHNHKSLREEIFWTLLQIRGKDDTLWFIAALFVMFIPFYFAIKIFESSSKSTTATILLVGVSFVLSFISQTYSNYMNPHALPWDSYHLPWHIESMFVGMFWMVLGYLFKQYWETSYDNRTNVIIILLSAIICLLLIYIPFINKYEFTNGVIKILYTFLKEFTSIFTLIFICKKIVPNKYNLFIGQNTILYFAFHGKVYSILQTVLKKISLSTYTAILSNTVTSSILAFILTLVLSVILIIPVYIVNTYFPFLIGRSKNK